MSNRTTQKNIPLPVLGSTGWGSNLNSYLRANSYRQSAIEEDLQDLYEQQNNATQTILSSGVMSLNVDTKMPGLYKNTGATWNYVNDGDEIETDGTYGYFGYGAVLSNVNIVKQLETTDQTGVDHHVLTINFAYSTTQYTGLDLQTSTSNYDARCVYAYYNNNTWSVRFATTASPSTETSISIHPQYICLGVVIQFGTKLYWHYKTMKSSLSLSVKKWMLDEPHASLDTYMNFNAGTKTLVPYVVSKTQPTKLHIQALGINPFSVNEFITSELDADLFTMDFATKNSDDNVVSNFVILHAHNDGSNTVYARYTPGTTGGVVINNYSNTTKYRICATSLRIDTGSEGNHAYKWVLLLQEAVNDSTLNTSLFNDNDFNRLYYYADPIELYRLENSSLHANPGNGISTINANGINPHVSTLLKNDDNVFFGESNSDYFHLKTEPDATSGVTRSGIVDVVIPNSTQTSPATSVILTDNMQAINTEIQIQNTLIGTGSETNVDNKILMRAGRSAKNYNNLSLHSHQGSEGGIMHFSGTGAIKLQAYTGKTSPFDIDTVTDAQASIDIYSKVDGDVSKAKIDLKSKYINLYGDTAVVPVTKNFQFNDGTGAYCVVQNPDEDRPRLLIGKTTDKQIALLADGDKATIKLGNISGGGCTTLSSDGLYLPSGNSGIKIDSITGTCENKTGSFKCSTNTTYAYKAQVAAVWPGKVIYYPTEYIPLSYYDALGIQGNKLYKLTDTHWKEISGASGTFFTLTLPENNSQYICLLTSSHPNTPSEKCPLDFYCVALIDTQTTDTGIEKEYNLYYDTNQKTSLLQLGTLTSSASGIRYLGENAQLSIMVFNQEAILSCVHNVEGKIRMHCNAGEVSIGTNGGELSIGTNGGELSIGNNSDTTIIGKNTGEIKITTDKWKAYKNIIGPTSYTINDTDNINRLVKMWNHLPDKSIAGATPPCFLYRNYDLTDSGDRNASARQMTLRRYFNYDAENIPKDSWNYLYLPDLRSMQFEIQIVDDKWDQKWLTAYFAVVKWDPLYNHLWASSCTENGSHIDYKVTRFGKTETATALDADYPDSERSFTFHIDNHAAFGIKLQYVADQSKFRIAWARISDICTFKHNAGNMCVIFTIVEAGTGDPKRWYSYTPVVGE